MKNEQPAAITAQYAQDVASTTAIVAHAAQSDVSHAPCPFCGGQRVEMRAYPGSLHAYVECRHCAAQGPVVRCEDRDKLAQRALEAWNTRSTAVREQWATR
jgi:Lar family restriction alleviation protein